MTSFTVTFDPQHFAGALHPARGEYVETYWLPLIGPSSYLLLRALVKISEDLGTYTSGPTITTHIPLAPLVEGIGLTYRQGRNSPMNKTLDRMETFKLIERPTPNTMTVATYLPTVTSKQLQARVPHLAALHDLDHPQPTRA